jgi:putative endopeptidase
MNRLICGAAATLCAVVAATAASAEAGPFYPPFGLDLSAVDASTSPRADFYQHVNGQWLARTAIPADQPGIDTFYEIFERTEDQLHSLLRAAAANVPAQPVTVREKVGAMYAAFMDETRIEDLRATPIEPELVRIRAAASRGALAFIMGAGSTDFFGSFFAPSIDIDVKDPAHYAILLNQSGLGLPNRDYYLNADFAKQKAAYQDYVARLLSLIQWPDAKAHAAAILALETRIAEASWPLSQQRDFAALYNPTATKDLATLAPGFPWADFLAGAGLAGKTRVIVGEKSAFPKIAAIFATTRFDTLQAWLAFTTADRAAAYLSTPFQQASFEFRDKTLSGQRQIRARWKRAVAAVAGTSCGNCFGTLNWAVGQLYVARYFTPATKAKAQSLTTELLHAFHTRIENLAWMGPATKTEALKKLDTYTVKVGYPDHPRDYANVAITSDDLIGDVRAAAAADWAFYVNRSAGPVDRTDWVMSPQLVNAYNGSLRDIVFPAAILQPPFFDPAADDAVNYGSIGAIIGHEMTHGFDDSGRALDAAGALRDWWTKADADAFKQRADLLGAEYAAFEPLPGLHIKPDQTMGENIADLGGVVIALDAYHASLNGKPAPVLGGLTGDQRFFMSWAQGWRIKASDDAIRESVVSDFHSYDKFRAIGPLQNVDAWYAAFDIKPGDKMYRAPELRAHIW